jgi:hypothetical protein
LEGGSEFVFVLMLLLLAKGFTVTRGRLRPASAVKLTLFNCTYVVVYGLLFVLERYVSSQILQLNVLDTEILKDIRFFFDRHLTLDLFCTFTNRKLGTEFSY